MKCPKCGFVSFDHIESCNKCGVDVKGARSLLNLPVSEPKVPSFLSRVVSGEEGAAPDVSVGGGMELGRGELIVEEEPMVFEEEPSLLDEDLDAGEVELPESEELELSEEMSLEPELIDDDVLEPEVFEEPELIDDEVLEPEAFEVPEPAVDEVLEPAAFEEPEPDLVFDEEPDIEFDLDADVEPAEEEAVETLDTDLLIDDSAIDDLGDLDIDIEEEEFDFPAEAPEAEPPSLEELPDIPALDEELDLTEEAPGAPATDLSIDDDALESLEIDLDDLKVEE